MLQTSLAYSQIIFYLFQLYSVKWYKGEKMAQLTTCKTIKLFFISQSDGYEFYRYVPRDHPPAQVFDQNGVNVDVSFCLRMSKFLMDAKYFHSLVNSCTTPPTLRWFWIMWILRHPVDIDVRFPPKLLHSKQSLTMVIWLLLVSLMKSIQVRIFDGSMKAQKLQEIRKTFPTHNCALICHNCFTWNFHTEKVRQNWIKLNFNNWVFHFGIQSYVHFRAHKKYE